jgi:hypothetical protein
LLPATTILLLLAVSLMDLARAIFSWNLLSFSNLLACSASALDSVIKAALLDLAISYLASPFALII